jgi:hypothetical protein
MINTQAQQESLVQRGLATKKVHGDFSTYKYSRKVMYDYLWQKEPLTLECRGHTYYNPTGELVLAAPRKTFNYLEDGNFKDLLLDTQVYAYRKYNGFLANARMFNGELIVGTTGTLTSSFAEEARRLILKSGFDVVSDRTMQFEIISAGDPHIVDDGVVDEAILLQYRFDNGVTTPNDFICEHVTTLSKMLQLAKTCKHEGWMLHFGVEGHIMKLKTDYYVNKKKIMRATDSKVEQMFNGNSFHKDMPVQWQDVVETIKYNFTEETWKSFNDQERRTYIEEIYG